MSCGAEKRILERISPASASVLNLVSFKTSRARVLLIRERHLQILPFKQVDVFTQKPFWGNPVAVVIGAECVEPAEMQRIAAWTNLSETTFVLRPSSANADYRLRIFSPKQELPFAGHPTIGSAHAVIESGFASPREGKLRQECLAGILDLSVETTETGAKIMVQAPAATAVRINDELLPLLISALGTPLMMNTPALRVDVGVVWLVVNMEKANAVAALRPDMEALVTISNAAQVTGVTVFGRSDDQASAVHVRSFAPAQGVPEDPVCGSGKIRRPILWAPGNASGTGRSGRCERGRREDQNWRIRRDLR
ncbi:MAG: PhzF family phenazine biosynthesis protein [Deltaproteobacteria bacterium]|nr:MAG: PhzF family phenazine biosynthesis protein [Deltaproteobacteria bacterium]